MLLLNPLKRSSDLRAGFPVMRGAFPLVGHLPALAVDTLALVRRAEKELGPFFWIQPGFGSFNLVCLLPEVFEIFRNTVTTSEYIRDVAHDAFGEALIGKDGPSHRHQRAAMSAPFTPRGLTENGTGDLLVEILERHLRGWIDRGAVTLLPAARELVLALAMRMLDVPEADLPAWRRDYEEFMLITLNLPFDVPGSPRQRGRAARTRLNERILGLLAAVRGERRTTGLLADLARGRDEQGRGLTEQELLDNFRLLVLAAHETTASTLGWMVTALAQRPDVWRALVAEARAASGPPRSPRDLKSFPYAEAVFREALRLHPPVAHDARRAREDFTLGGRTIPGGTMVTISIIHLSRHPSLHERPDEFLPERWLGRSAPLSPLELVQFGGGPHFCLGYHVAWMESVQFAVILARMLDERGLRPVLDGRPAAPRYLPLLHPDGRARVRFAA